MMTGAHDEPAAAGYETLPSARDLRADAVARLIDQAARAVHAPAALATAARALSPAQWAALRYFHRARDADATMMGLVRYQRIAPATASETISLLVRRGLLVKERAPHDRRQYLLRLTPTAAAIIDHDPLGALTRALNDLDDATLATLKAGLETAVASLGSADPANGAVLNAPAAGVDGPADADAAPTE